MANKIKSNKKPAAAAPKAKAPDPEQMKPEKEEQVTFKSLSKDERTHKILGVVCLLIAVVLFIAFTSYLFTWKKDQDKVFRNGIHFLTGENIDAANLLGRLGAYISHFFIYKGFGIASYLICTFFFIAGVNFIFGRKVFSLLRNLKYVVVGLVIFSIVAAFLTRGDGFAWGGAVGEMVNDWLQKFIGWIGTAALLLVAALSYIIWRFNPVFRLPEKKTLSQVVTALNSEEVANVEDTDHTATNVDEQSGGKLFIEEEQSAAAKGNTMKGNGGVVVIPPKNNADNNPLTDFKVVEKDIAPEDIPLTVNEPAVAELPEEALNDVNELPLEIGEEDILELPTLGRHTSPEPAPPPAKKEEPLRDQQAANLELEIKTEKALPPTEPELASAKSEKLAPYEPTLDLRDYKYPTLDLLETHGSEKIVQDPAELEANKNQIINTLKNYDISIQKISATVGPTVTLYEIVPAAGVRISRIKNLEDDIALSLAALGIRIIAPIPGKGTIGIEVPNVKKTVVSMKSLLASEKFQHNAFSLPIAIGKKIDNENFIVDLAAMPHLLMAGATGQGKSVGLNAILVSLLYKKHPSQLKLVLVDPKKVELSLYRTIEKHFLAKLPGEEEAIITDTKKVISTLNALCIEMDNRYDLLKEAGTRNIREYNEKFIQRKLNPQKGHQYLPFIVLVVDEFADLIMTAGKEVEMPIARLAQLARAVGIHLIIATQRPSVNIITGTIKANFPARIAFKVSSKIDSRTILDTGGAEQLIGKGDMLISYNGEITRLQCAFVDTPEVDNVTEFIGDQRGYPQAFLLPEYIDEKDMEGKDFDLGDRDPLFGDAARLVVQNQVGSTSLIQRRMKLGYNRAGRLMDQLEAAGVVGPNQGSKARDVLIKTEHELDAHLDLIG
jgi:DNA segregation ATPase FtsK/SpoIIIE, S-DNA-T family